MEKIWHSIDDYDFIEISNLEDEEEKLLDYRFLLVKKEYEKKLSDYNYEEISIDKYNIVFIINKKYAVYLGLLCQLYCFSSNEKENITLEEYINKTCSIFIEILVYDDKFNVNDEELSNRINEEFNYSFIQTCEVCQYFFRSNKNEKSNFYSDEEYYNLYKLRFDNNDKFHSIAKKVSDKIDLYKLLEHNQNVQTISDNYDIKKVIKYFNKVRKLIEKELSNFIFEYIKINDYEGVYLLEDTLVMYVGVKGQRALFEDKNSKNGNIIDRYCIVIQELTYNELFKSRKFSKFIKTIHIMSGTTIGAEYSNNIYYRPFALGNRDEKIVKSYHPRFYFNSNFYYVDKMVPKLKLEDRFVNCNGEARYYIVYEFIYYKNKIGYAVASTLDSNPHVFAMSKLRQYENEGGYLMYFPGIYYDNSWGDLLNEFVNEQKDKQWSGYKRIGEKSSILAEKVQFFVVPMNVNNINIHEDIESNIVNDAKKGKYDSYERTLYDITEYKWKSEELMFDCVKKVFNKREVIHQYRPYFLNQQSYDVFVCGVNVAFEYQGKQHFEPINIFGGEENFKKQQERDKNKKKLSEKNNITLIYINYWEDVTVELIKEKLKEKNIKF